MNKARPKTKPDSKPDGKDAPPPDGTRETIESIAMAIVLALIFRSFVAEAFVIPTGSMAPTLMGRHKDVFCPECNCRYQVGASNEVTKEGSPNGNFVIGSSCPSCGVPWSLDLYKKPNDDSFSGDRIIVGKFAYDFEEPKRWDVIVFKFPGNARDNYIKRLVGLPNETVRIAGGNVYTRQQENELFRIARKPPAKLDVMLQPVFDTKYLSPTLKKIGWPEFWYTVPPDAAVGNAAKNAWEILDDGHRFHIAATDGQMHWLRYRNHIPDTGEWEKIFEAKLPASATEPAGVVADNYAYNSGLSYGFGFDYPPSRIPPNVYDPAKSPTQQERPPTADAAGQHWVDDLALDAEVEVKSAAGTLALELIRGGAHYRCSIDVATGNAKLAIVDWNGAEIPFAAEGATPATSATATTSVKGPGKYRLRLSNVDHELLLWVNGNVVISDQPTTYDSSELIEPHWTPQDPGDTEPALIGMQGGELEVGRLIVSRDKYYIAVQGNFNQGIEASDYNLHRSSGAISGILAEPSSWATEGSELFKSRRSVEFPIPKDCFFPMGDNSPHSQDARMWQAPLRTSPYDPQQPDPVPWYVERDLLVGKALLVYWPHSWNRPYLWPNFSRMKWIR